jgi:hypothetical protein
MKKLSWNRRQKYKYYTENQSGIFIIRSNHNGRTDNTIIVLSVLPLWLLLIINMPRHFGFLCSICTFVFFSFEGQTIQWSNEKKTKVQILHRKPEWHIYNQK